MGRALHKPRVKRGGGGCERVTSLADSNLPSVTSPRSLGLIAFHLHLVRAACFRKRQRIPLHLKTPSLKVQTYQSPLFSPPFTLEEKNV